MSDTPMGDGWWQASDGKWYPPEQHPDVMASDTPAADEPPAAGEPVPADEPTTVDTPVAGGGAAAAGAPAAGGPPPTAPPAGAAAAGASDGSGSGSKRTVIGVIVVLILAAGAFAAFTFLGDDEASASEVTLESIGDVGADPYTAPIAPAPSASLADFAESGAPEGAQLADLGTDEDTGYATADGGVPGVFGGTLDEVSCDASQLAAFLDAEPEKAAAWAAVVEIDPGDIAAYVDSLTPTNLTSDTRVLNHGFVDGAASPRESVLQRGTAVLVDTRGVPRVNCYSGNPLREPEAVADEDFVGDSWTGFTETEVLVVREAPTELSEFELLDYRTGERFRRPAGAAQVEEEADDTATEELGEDREIEPNTLVEEEISEARPEARYTVEIPDGAVITLTVANERESINRILVTMEVPGNRLDSFRVAPGDEEERTFVLDHDAGDIYELVISEGPAAFALEVGVEVQDDAGQGVDAGDDLASALELTPGEQVDGLLGTGDSTDLYTMQLEPGTELRLTASNARESNNRFLLRLDTEGSQLFSERVSPGADTEFSVLLGPDDDGALDISVIEGGADYTFTIELVDQQDGLVDQQDGGEVGDAGNDLASARDLGELAAGSEIAGEVGNRDDGDYYLFTPTSGLIQLTATVDVESSNRMRLAVLGPDGSQIESFRVNPGATETIELEVEPGAQHQLQIFEGRARYSITIG